MAGVFNNATGEQQCYELPTDDEDDAMWDYIWCTETLPQETYFAMDGVHDMFCAISRCVLGRSSSHVHAVELRAEDLQRELHQRALHAQVRRGAAL